MRMILVFLLVISPCLLLAQDRSIGSMVSELEEEVIVGESGIVYEEEEELVLSKEALNPVVAPVNEPVNVQANTPAPSPASSPISAPVEQGDIYYYSYSPKDDKAVNYIKDSEEILAGQPGSFVFTFNGEFINYNKGSKSRGGASIEFGPQFVLCKYMSFTVTASLGAREGNEEKNNLYPIGFKLAPRFRVLSWLFPFIEGGAEFAKVAKGKWESPFWVLGGGFLFNLGAMDKNAEYNFNKSAFVRRTLIIAAFDKIKSPDVKISTPDAYIFRLGFSLEF